MNKHLHRIVFNHALGLFQVVSELVRRPGQGATSADGIVATSVRPVSLSLWVAFGWIGLASVASAQIAPDMQAPGNQRATVMAAPNNAPLINIQTPSAAGVSRNTYNRFNVGNEGAVLNNSRTNTQTQLAGSVSGNPWLANGTAKVILNEVTGPNPSQLNGYIEVAGDRAQVVIANPSGIACDGCGFINANRVTLTTGVPVLNGGALDGYRVTGGTIQINGNGMDASRADFADIIARAVQVNGGIWAPQLQVTTGANQVNVDQTHVSTIGAEGDKPTFALDVSALGGMYANKIALLGTEHGLGVRNAGNIGAQAGELTVTADGRLENTGSLQSQTNTQINASGGVANAGTLSATRELSITTPQDVDNSGGSLNAARIAVDAGSLRNAGGTLAQSSAQGITMDVGSLSNRNGGRIGMPEVDAGAGGDNSATTPGASNGSTGHTGSSGDGASSGGGNAGVTSVAPLADGVLHIAGLLDNDGGRITAATGFDLTARNGLANDGGQLALRQLTLNGGDLSNRAGVLNIDKASTIHAAQVVNDEGELTFTKGLSFDAQSLSNRAGKFVMADTAAMVFQVTGALDNTGGMLASNATQFSLSSGSLINERGTIHHAGTEGFSLTTGAWQGATGTLATAGAATITAGTVDHLGATLRATQLTLHADNMDNRGGLIAASGEKANTLQVDGTLDNGQGGNIQSNADLAINAATLGNAGGTVLHAGQGALDIHATTLNGAGGTLASNGTLTVTGNTADLRNGTTYAQAIAIDTGALTTADGSLTALGTDALRLRAGNVFDNAGGKIATNGALQLDAGSLDNAGGTLSAGGYDDTHVQVAGTFINTTGTLAAVGATTLHAGALVNQGGVISQGGTSFASQSAGGAGLSVSTDGLLDNSAKGTITSDGDLSITASRLDNTQGAIAHAGTGALTIQAGALNGQTGSIASNGALTLKGGALNLRDGTTYAQAITLDADALTTAGGNFTALGGTPLNLNVRGLFDNTHGTVATNGALLLTAQSLTNADGTLTAAGTGASVITVANAFDNTRGTLAAMGATTVHGGSIINQGGTVQAGNGATLTVTADGVLDNSQHGLLASDGDLSVTANTLDNTLGTIQHAGQGALIIQAAALNGQGGTIASNGALSLNGGAINLRDGTTYAQSITLDADALTTAGGSFTALGGTPLNLNVRGLFDNTHGTVATNGTLQLTTQSLTNTDGTLTAAGTGATSITVAHGFDNTRGTLAAMGATTVHGGSIVNQAGVIQAGGGSTLSVTADGLLNNSQQGLLASDGDLTVTAATLDNTLGAIKHAGQGALSIQATTLNGQGGTIASNGALTLTGNATNLRDGTTEAQQITVDTGSLTTADGTLSALGNSALQLSVRGAMDNSGGHIATNGALQLTAGSLVNANGSLLAAGTNANQLTIANAFDNTHGTLGTGGTLTLHSGSLDNTGGSVQSASTDALTVTTDGQLTNDSGSLIGNGALVLHAGAVSNHGGAIQAQQDITANVAGTLDNNGGALIAGGDANLTAASLLNRETNVGGTTPHGIYGHRVQLQADTIDNTRGQIRAADALTLGGRTQGRTALVNADGVIDGTGTVTVLASSFDNAAGQLIQRGDTGALSIDASGQLGNISLGLIGAEGHATIQAGAFDNSGGTTFARHDLTVTSRGDLINRNKGQLQSTGAMTVGVNGVLDNSGGTLDAGGTANITVNTIVNVDGQVLAGNAATPEAALHLTSAGAIDNRGGTIGNRGGDLFLRGVSIDNSARGTLAAQRDMSLDAVGSLNNGNGTTYATRNLSYQNSGATLANAGGTVGADGTAWLNLGMLTNTAGHVQANTLWLTTPQLNNDGDIGANVLHATVASLSGAGYIHGTDLMDAHFLGDYTHQAGRRIESNGTLTLTVDGTLINQGTLQTQGELDITAGNLVNQGSITASAHDGSASAHIRAWGTIDNQSGAGIEGDNLSLSASDIVNTSSRGIVGDAVHIDANNLTNGRDLGTADAAIAYGEGFIGASQSLDLRVAQRLANLDGDIYSGGDLTIAGRADGTRVATLDNMAGRIQADGNGSIAADTINNRRRFVETEQYTLSAGEQYALSSERQYDAVYASLSPAEKQALANMGQNPPKASGLSAADERALFVKLGWVRVTDVAAIDPALKAALDTTYHDRAVYEFGLRDGGFIGPVTADVKQFDTYITGTRITRESADAQILTGGNLSIDLGTRLTNFAATIAATGNLDVSGQSYDGSPDGRIDNIAITGSYTGERTTTAWTREGAPARFQKTDGSWGTNPAAQEQGSITRSMIFDGPVLAGATITGKNVSLTARNITNTTVAASDGLVTLDGGQLQRQGSVSTGNAHTAQAGGAGTVDGASGDGVQRTGTASEASGSEVGRTGMAGAASGGSVSGPRASEGATGQTIGSTDQPLPGYAPPSNGKYAQHGDPGAPFLVTTTPRFAKGASTSSDYLLRALGDDPSNTQKRLGDGYYEQQLVLDQLLQLTGRRTLSGADGLAQYQSLMDGAAAEAGRLGLQLGAPLTSTQIASLSSDIVWLVDQVVDGQHVLVPVVYLSKATADRLRSDGALIAGDNVNIKASGTVSNDGTITGTQGTTISADTLINHGAISGGDRLAIATQGNTVNNGTLSGGSIGITAGGSVINGPAFDGVVAHGGVINADTGGLQVSAVNDVINQGKITSAGDGLIIAGRDVVQNTAVAGNTAQAAAGSIMVAGSAAVIAGRDAIFDSHGTSFASQASLAAGKVAYVEAGRDARFTAATVSGGTGIAIKAGQDIVSDAVTDHHASISGTQDGRTKTYTATADTTTRGSTFQSGGDITMQAGRDIGLTAANVKADGAIGVAAGRDINLATGENTRTQTQDSNTRDGKKKTTTHIDTTDTQDIGTTLSGGRGVALIAGNDIHAKAAEIDGGKGAVQLGAGRDINLTTGEATHSETSDSTTKKSGFWSSSKVTTHSETSDTTAIGTTISGAQGVALAAGRDINAVAATVTSSDGAVVLHAERDINLLAGQNTHSESHDTQNTKSGVLTKKEITTHDATVDTTAVGTVISGKQGVALDAGRNVLGIGTTLQSSDGGIAITAGDQVALLAAQDTHSTDHSEKVRRSGVEWVPNPKQGTQKKETITGQTTAVGSTLDAHGPIVIASGGDQTYQAANISSDTGTALISGGAINFVTATESETYQRDSSKHNVAYQAQDHRQRVDTTEVQTNISGPVAMAAADGITIGVGQKEGETQEQAIARASQQGWGTGWIADMQGQNNVSWQSIDEQHIDEHQHHEGMTQAAATVVTVVVSYFTAGLASSAVGSTLGASGGTFAAAGTGTAATAAGVGNAIASGAITGAVAGGVNAGVQGYDVGQGAWTGLYSGAVTGGLFYEAGSLGQQYGWRNGGWEKTLAHSVAGGAANGLTGGSVLNGMISGGFAEWSSPYVEQLGGGTFGQTLAHGGAGAASSWLTGGDVGQGALNGAWGYLFNEVMHYERTPDGKMTVKAPTDDPKVVADSNAAVGALISWAYNGLIAGADTAHEYAPFLFKDETNIYNFGGAPMPTYAQTLSGSGAAAYTFGSIFAGAAIFAVTDRLPEVGSPRWGALTDAPVASANLWGPAKNASGDLDAAANAGRNQPYAYDVPPAKATGVEFLPPATRYSAGQIQANTTQSSAIEVLELSGYKKTVSQDGAVTVLTNGEKTYRFYPASTSTGQPSASLTIEGEKKPVVKIRFKGV